MQEPVIPPGWRRKPVGDESGESVLRADDPPIYAVLAERWWQAGRMLPGQADREWSELVAHVPDLGLGPRRDAGLPSGVVPWPEWAGAVGGARPVPAAGQRIA